MVAVQKEIPSGADDADQGGRDQAEQSLLGALLLDPTAWGRVSEIVRETDLESAEHRLIFRAIAAVIARGLACDATTVIDALHARGQLEAIAGGNQYIARLVEDTPSAANVDSYARLVREKSDKRRLISIANDVAATVRERGLEPALELAQASVTELSRSRHSEPRERAPLDWSELQCRTPPQREWADEHWFGMGHVTLLAGAGGTGKTSVAQALGSCLALGRDYLNRVGLARRVLMWAAEDDEPELWRRQLAIAEWLGVSLEDFAGRFTLHSYDGEQVELAALVDQRHLIATPQYKTLCEQIGDYKADVVILDNVARLYGADENNRHQVTGFVAMLTAAARPTNAAVMLLAHPGKASGSEYSGSTAWEGAVRARLYLGRTLPDSEIDAGEAVAEDGVRYLCRRKANYSPLDWRRLTYSDGVMVPEAPVSEQQGGQRSSPLYAQGIVKAAIRKLAEMGEHGSASTASPNYLPKLAQRFKLLEQSTYREFAAAMNEMWKAGTLVQAKVGMYSNRTPREGLVLA